MSYFTNASYLVSPYQERARTSSNPSISTINLYFAVLETRCSNCAVTAFARNGFCREGVGNGGGEKNCLDELELFPDLLDLALAARATSVGVIEIHFLCGCGYKTPSGA
jgi:hypothetical protein